MTKQVSAADAETVSAATSPVAAVNGDAGIGDAGTGTGAGRAAKSSAKSRARSGAGTGGAAKAKVKAQAPTAGNAKAGADNRADSRATVKADEGPAAGLTSRHATLRYTTLRVALFLAALVLVWIVAVLFHMDLTTDTSRLIMIAVALFLSSAASLVLLSKQRDEMSAGIVARTQRLGRKFNDAATFEDADED